MTKRAFASRFPSAAESPGFLLCKAANAQQRRQRRALAELGISPTQSSLLASFFFLSRTHGRPISQAELAEHAAIDEMLVADGTRALRVVEEADAAFFARTDDVPAFARLLTKLLTPAPGTD